MQQQGQKKILKPHTNTIQTANEKESGVIEDYTTYLHHLQ
jgi:thiamine phosphate synthase YjbQ (UPF0047 family)